VSSYFERLDAGRYRPTVEAGGAWSPGEIHFSPLGGLIVHAMEFHRSGQDDSKQLSRVSFDILGFLAAEDIEIAVTTIRPGRTIELVEAVATIAGRRAVLARAWYVSAGDTSAVAGGLPDALPAPSELEPSDVLRVWPGGYVASLDARPVGELVPGRTTAWLRTDVDLVAGENVGPVASFIALVDTANGIAVRQQPGEWMFPNLDLTIHLYRQPTGPWVGFDTTVTFGATGLGLTSTALHDENGPVGRAEQTLTVRPLH
jgi:hypothetical protein